MKKPNLLEVIRKICGEGKIQEVSNGKYRRIYAIASGMEAAENFEIRNGKLYRVRKHGYSDELVTTL